MRSIIITLLLSIIAAPALAAEKPPFSWPPSYVVTVLETGKSKHTIPTTTVFNVDGQKVRRRFLGPKKKTKTEIFRPDQRKKIVLFPNGTTREAPLPDSWRPKAYFPSKGQWELVGNDTLDKQPALKYKITRDAGRSKRPVIAWLSEDGKTPLRVEDGSKIFTFSNYSADHQGTSLFEPPANK